MTWLRALVCAAVLAPLAGLGPAPARAAGHACCAGHHKQAPAKVPCSQMSCCRVALPNAAVSPMTELSALAPVSPSILVPAAPPSPLKAALSNGPPERPLDAPSGLSPPAVLG